MKTTIVVAALIEQDNRLLVCQRRRSDPFPLLWEFPGGKVHDGETPAQALARELIEELGVQAQIGREVYRTRYRYPELPDELELIFFTARIESGALRNLAFEQIVWVRPQELPQMEFLPADKELITLLAEQQLKLRP
jgi:8-oxo-dGTP diphosphatase